MSGNRRTGRLRGQGGFTLIEVLLVVAVGAMIAIPLLGWMVLGIKTERQNSIRSIETTGSNQARSLVSRDVASSTAVALGGLDCTGGSTSVAVVATVTRAVGASSTHIAYTVAADPEGGHQLMRRQCAAPGDAALGDLVVSSRVVEPAGGWTGLFTCADRPGRTGDTCGEVTVSLPFESGRTATVRATRRIGLTQ